MSNVRAIIFILTLLLVSLAVGCTITSVSEPTVYPSPQYRFQETAVPPAAQAVPTTGNVAPLPTSVSSIPSATPVFANPVPTAIPGGEVTERTENIVDAIINRVFIPLWNVIYTLITGTITSLWEFAGLRGGIMAQTIFCLVPGIVVILGLLWRFFRRAR